MTTYCANELCENEAVKTVKVSVRSGGDQERAYCAACEEAYTVGVQHGTFLAGPVPVPEAVPPVQQVRYFKGVDDFIETREDGLWFSVRKVPQPDGTHSLALTVNTPPVGFFAFQVFPKKATLKELAMSILEAIGESQEHDEKGCTDESCGCFSNGMQHGREFERLSSLELLQEKGVEGLAQVVRGW